MNLKYRSLNPYCEPNLAKRGLYPKLGGGMKQRAAGPQINTESNKLDTIRWLIFYGDGNTSLSYISQKTGIPCKELYEVAEELRMHKLLEIVPSEEEAH